MAGRIGSLGFLFERMEGPGGREGLTTLVEDEGRELGSQIYELGMQLNEHLRRHAA